MLAAAFRALPLHSYDRVRRLAVRLPRGSLVRNICLLVLKHAALAYRGRIADEIEEIVPLDCPGVSFEPVDSMVMDAVYWFGIRGYEGTVTDVWVRLCRRSRSILEIGGNVGLFAVIGGRAASGSYTVIEPVPEIAAVLRANLRRNGLEERVVVRQAAAIPDLVAREVVLNVPAEGRRAPVGAHLIEGIEITGRSSERRLAVHGMPMRDLMAERDLIKIDAEGIEAELLSAARDLLLSDRPDLLIEVLPEAKRLGAMLSQLGQDAGYRMYVLPEYGLDSIVEVDPAKFTAKVPQRYNSKDILLTTKPLG
jgi:FkbM family methyltransferase